MACKAQASSTGSQYLQRVHVPLLFHPSDRCCYLRLQDRLRRASLASGVAGWRHQAAGLACYRYQSFRGLEPYSWHLEHRTGSNAVGFNHKAAERPEVDESSCVVPQASLAACAAALKKGRAAGG